MPVYQYAISGVTENLSRKDPAFYSRLPSNRHGDAGAESLQSGIFLEGVSEFLGAHLEELEDRYGQKIEKIRIILEKHGAFYHPCRVILNDFEEKPLVVNGATTQHAGAVMRTELEALHRLWDQGIRDIPEVFFSGTLFPEEPGEVSFFAGEWFAGFCEFHWSVLGDEKAVWIWEDFGERPFLSIEKTSLLIRKMAMILTRAYDFDNFRQIFPWHHAAGDFVARLQQDEVDARLITVRQYTCLFSCDSEMIEFSDKIEALLYFLWNMLLRMRLDRLDGVGDLMWAPDFVVPAAISGFFAILSEKAVLREDIAMVTTVLPEIILSGGREGLFQMHEDILAAYHPDTPERNLIQEKLREHSDLIYVFFAGKK